MKTVSVVIPVYNEERTVEVLLRRVLAAPLPGELDREVVVVDDTLGDGMGDTPGEPEEGDCEPEDHPLHGRKVAVFGPSDNGCGESMCDPAESIREDEHVDKSKGRPSPGIGFAHHDGEGGCAKQRKDEKNQ